MRSRAMKGLSRQYPGLEASSLLGVAASVGLLFPAILLSELSFLALPAFALMVPSLLYSLR